MSNILDEMLGWLSGLAFAYGYVGVLIVAILGNVVPFMPIPYLIIVYELAILPQFDPLTLGVVGGFGAAVGKLSSYVIGWGGARVVGKEKREELESLRGLVNKYGALAALMIAATPLPDDVVLISLGLIRYSAWKYFLACSFGKIILTLMIAYTSWSIRLIFGGDQFLVTVVSIAFLAVMLYITFKLDWIRIASVIHEGGWSGVFKLIRENGLKALTLKSEREKKSGRR